MEVQNTMHTKNDILIHSLVDLAEKKDEPGKNLKKDNFGIIRKQIFID